MALPNPQLGLVISYAYLWRHEHDDGRDSGGKDRPCVIILAAEQEGGGTRVTVVPITHSAPADPDGGLELPAAVKRHLGLDDLRSWVVLTEGNRFLWPGYDLRPIRGKSGRFDYGLLPPRLYRDLVERFAAIWTSGQGRHLPRD